MELIESLKKMWHRTPAESTKKTDLTGLPEKLDEMRGDHITIVDAPDEPLSDLERIENREAAMKDMGWVDRDAEEDLLNKQTSYRKSK
jgi:hypothetical protein